MLFWAQVLYNKLLSNLASSSHTAQYWSLTIFGQASLCLAPTATNSGQYSPVQPLHSVSTKLLFKERCLLLTITIFNALIYKLNLNEHILLTQLCYQSKKIVCQVYKYQRQHRDNADYFPVIFVLVHQQHPPRKSRTSLHACLLCKPKKCFIIHFNVFNRKPFWLLSKAQRTCG